jgi:nitrous oxide reductase accessory protein NosL
VFAPRGAQARACRGSEVIPMRSKLLLLLPLFALACKGGDPAAAHSKAAPIAAAQGLDVDGTFHVGAQDRCPICGMTPAKRPTFAGAIELKDGRTFYTCGPGCLLRSHLHPEAFLGVDASAVKRVVAQDYLNGKPIDAAQAVWVAGSDVVGPMGPAMVPLASAEDEAAFRARHGGKATFRLRELDDAKWESLTGRKALPEPK